MQGADLDLWVLASSGGESARVAGELGLPLAANYHVSPSTVLETVEQYRDAFRPGVLDAPYVVVSADVLAADTDARATALADGFVDWVLSIRGGGGAAAVRCSPMAVVNHTGQVVTDLARARRFYEEVLGFRLSDWIGDYFVFLRCGPDHHTVNFIRGPVARMHHMAFEVKDTSHLANACDLLGRKNLEIVWGPVRHGPGHNIAVYHRNPDDQMIEFFTDLDRMYDEEGGYYEPRSWHKDRPQKPKVWDPNQQRDIWGPPPTADYLRQRE